MLLNSTPVCETMGIVNTDPVILKHRLHLKGCEYPAQVTVFSLFQLSSTQYLTYSSLGPRFLGAKNSEWLGRLSTMEISKWANTITLIYWHLIANLYFFLQCESIINF